MGWMRCDDSFKLQEISRAQQDENFPSRALQLISLSILFGSMAFLILLTLVYFCVVLILRKKSSAHSSRALWGNLIKDAKQDAGKHNAASSNCNLAAAPNGYLASNPANSARVEGVQNAPGTTTQQTAAAAGIGDTTKKGAAPGSTEFVRECLEPLSEDSDVTTETAVGAVDESPPRKHAKRHTAKANAATDKSPRNSKNVTSSNRAVRTERAGNEPNNWMPMSALY